MEKRIYKYQIGLPSCGETTVHINGELIKILDIQEQNDIIVIWIEIDISKGSQYFKVGSVWTGDEVPDERYEYFKTIQSKNGLVYHYYIYNPLYNFFDI